MYVPHSSVRSLFAFVQNEAPDSQLSCLSKERYRGGLLMHCPALNALEQSSDEVLKNIMMQAKGVHHSIEPVQAESRTLSLPPEDLLKAFPIKGEQFVLHKEKEPGYSASNVDTRINCVNESALIKSILFRYDVPQEWQDYAPRFLINLRCNHWTTAIKLNLLICHLFNMDVKKVRQWGVGIIIEPEDERQFIDIAQVLLQPHEFDEEICKRFEYILTDVMVTSKEESIQSKGRELADII